MNVERRMMNNEVKIAENFELHLSSLDSRYTILPIYF